MRYLRQDLVNRVWGPACALSTLSDIFRGKRRPSLEVLRALVLSLNMMAQSAQAGQYSREWRSETQWVQAWSRAEYNRTHPARGLHSANRLFALEAAAKRPRPRTAARLLAELTVEIAEEVLEALPAPTVTAVLTAVIEVQVRRGRDIDRSEILF